MHCAFAVDLSVLPTRGPCSKYELSIAEGDFRGALDLTFESEPMRVGVNTVLVVLFRYVCLFQILVYICILLAIPTCSGKYVLKINVYLKPICA